ncbi:hypothetical protein BDQ94DRAFT_134541 [Aspergillus welwitschiae]|uniref:Uncharacterized protein n=1 Tax=Aspergillus welwitschiae TaxID=1341132 RepID=A0A3F3QHH3_9EURO|nr:hypothetical protein BDQ94DRAFT_134541 [Aspergillus welwitschiae]RDH38754.1 hypothetical protein BDQ94DRAFT_134541 [Aspergillus welwitschiae]
MVIIFPLGVGFLFLFLFYSIFHKKILFSSACFNLFYSFTTGAFGYSMSSCKDLSVTFKMITASPCVLVRIERPTATGDA